MTIPDEKFYRAQITQRVDFAPDLWMFRIRSGGEFKFVPGQYATLGVEAKGKRVERPYSIASAPSENEVEFFFELVPEGALTPLLYKLQPGDLLLAIDGGALANNYDLVYVVKQKHPGDHGTLQVERQGKAQVVDVLFQATGKDHPHEKR